MKQTSFLISFVIFIVSNIAYSQSFKEKPSVPVFYVKGVDVVRVDCWGIESANMESVYLEQTEHPKVFTRNIELNNSTHLTISVSTLKAENTLKLDLDLNGSAPDISVETYGLDSTLKYKEINITCDIFTGELEEN